MPHTGSSRASQPGGHYIAINNSTAGALGLCNAEHTAAPTLIAKAFQIYLKTVSLSISLRKHIRVSVCTKDQSDQWHAYAGPIYLGHVDSDLRFKKKFPARRPRRCAFMRPPQNPPSRPTGRRRRSRTRHNNGPIKKFNVSTVSAHIYK